jgi:hypothetical protein
VSSVRHPAGVLLRQGFGGQVNPASAMNSDFHVGTRFTRVRRPAGILLRQGFGGQVNPAATMNPDFHVGTRFTRVRRPAGVNPAATMRLRKAGARPETAARM